MSEQKITKEELELVKTLILKGKIEHNIGVEGLTAQEIKHWNKRISWWKEKIDTFPPGRAGFYIQPEGAGYSIRIEDLIKGPIGPGSGPGPESHQFSDRITQTMLSQLLSLARHTVSASQGSEDKKPLKDAVQFSNTVQEKKKEMEFVKKFKEALIKATESDVTDATFTSSREVAIELAPGLDSNKKALIMEALAKKMDPDGKSKIRDKSEENVFYIKIDDLLKSDKINRFMINPTHTPKRAP